MNLDVALNIGLVAVGLAMLCYGGNWLVNGGVAIAQKFRISNLVIGMTVVAYGTSTPELAASLAAAGQHNEIILGNIVGSNIANIGMVIGIISIIIPIVVKKTTLKKEIPLMLGFSLLLILLSVDGEISQYDGILLLILLIIFTIYMYRGAQSEPEDVDSTLQKKNVYLKAFLLLIVGIIFLYVGAKLTVDNSVIVAKTFGISERIIGLTVIAIGTSLPELLTSVIAIKKGHTDIGIGNIIGSNVYNILMIMGVTSAIAGVAIVDQVFYDYAIMIAFSLGLFAVILKGMITRPMGIGLSVAYVFYLVSGFLLD